MSQIRCLYHDTAPDFPATDQHPNAVRYGPVTLADGSIVFVDAIGGLPTSDEITAVLNPPAPVPSQISDRQFFQQLAISGTITQSEALAAVKVGTIPASLQAIIDAMPADRQFNAEMLVVGATVFARAHPMTVAIGTAVGMTAGQVDDFFRAAVAL